MERWAVVLAVAVGGALGANARYWLGLGISRWAGTQFPWATLTINLSGSFVLGFVATAMTHWLPHPQWRLLVQVGFLGGYTTFSTYMFESLALWERGEWLPALSNMLGSVLAGFAAVVLGVLLARGLLLPEPDRAPRPERDVRQAARPHPESDPNHARQSTPSPRRAENR